MHLRYTNTIQEDWNVLSQEIVILFVDILIFQGFKCCTMLAPLDTKQNAMNVTNEQNKKHTFTRDIIYIYRPSTGYT
jgi:hypothetical protein